MLARAAARSSTARSGFRRTLAATSTVDPVTPLPRRPNDVVLATLQIKGYVLDHMHLITNDIHHSAKAAGIRSTLEAKLPTVRERFRLNRSPFVHKKSQEEFQRLHYTRKFWFFGSSSLSHDATKIVHFLRYLEHELFPAHATAMARVELFSYEVIDPDKNVANLHLRQPSAPFESAPPPDAMLS